MLFYLHVTWRLEFLVYDLVCETVVKRTTSKIKFTIV